MLSLPMEWQDPFLDKIKSDLESSNQNALAEIVSRTLMPTKHRDHFARAIEVYTLQIECCRMLLESESFDQAALDNNISIYILNVQEDPLENLGNIECELPEEKSAVLNQVLDWKPARKPADVRKQLEFLNGLKHETFVIQQKKMCCSNLLVQESFDAFFLKKVKLQYRSDLKKLFDEFVGGFEELLKYKDQFYDSQAKSFVDIQSKNGKDIQVAAFKQKMFMAEFPMYEKWEPALTPWEVFKDNTRIEERFTEASIDCTRLTEATMAYIYEQTQIHQETRKKIFFQWAQESATLKRLTFSTYQQPYYNLVKQGHNKPLVKRFKNDHIKRKDRLAFLERYAPEALHIACANNQLNMVRFLVEKIKMLQQKNEAGYYPIHYAVMGSKEGEGTDLLTYLLENGADVNARGPFGYTPMDVAIVLGRLDLVIFLHKKGAHVDGVIEPGHFHLKPIHLAALYDKMDIVTFLLDHGANPFFLNQERHSALVEAILENNKATLVTFFRHGIWLNAFDRRLLSEHLNLEKITSLLALGDYLTIDEHDRSVLRKASLDNPLSLDHYLDGIWDEFNRLTIKKQIYAIQETYALKLLSMQSFHPELIKELEKEYHAALQSIDSSIDLSDEPGLNMTFKADLTPQEVFDFLLTRQSTLQLTQKHCYKLFTIATQLKYAFQLGTPELFLIERQEEREIAQKRHPDYYKIFKFCFDGALESLKALSRPETLKNYLLEACPPALHVAYANNQLALVRFFIEVLKMPMVPDEYGRYVVHYSALPTIASRYDSLSYLIQSGANINTSDHCFWTTVHMACLQGDLFFLKFLVNCRGSLQGVKEGYDTPLHVAATHNKPTIVSYLLEKGVDVLALNQNGHTPLVSAILQGHLNIALLFLQQGHWLNVQEKATLVVYLKENSDILGDASIAVACKSISRCLTLEKNLMALIDDKLSPHPVPGLPETVSAEIQESSVPPNSVLRSAIHYLWSTNTEANKAVVDNHHRTEASTSHSSSPIPSNNLSF